MTPQSDNRQEVDIEAAFKEGTPIEKALNRAVREAVLLHRKLGLPMAVWRDNQAVWVDPDDPDNGHGPTPGEFNCQVHEKHEGADETGHHGYSENARRVQ